MTGISDATQPVVVFRGAPVPISSLTQALFAAAMQIISDRTLLPFRFGPAKLPLDDAGSDALELPSSKLDAALAWL
ncbi:834de90b-d3db-4938-b599-776f90aca2a4 [Thermothielavioides terrestris]|uniref:834de90b-d3db-4938-b599-776f90aca2a4 n=1 Tax=Thermothielavioides terrestris TaxID=2587410 RepID=A0A3S4ATA5_9PEZI|nr:834de90b-d3db-4938-b599-776f90aca2a4 [Thermothielavioides terrestris]